MQPICHSNPDAGLRFPIYLESISAPYSTKARGISHYLLNRNCNIEQFVHGKYLNPDLKGELGIYV